MTLVRETTAHTRRQRWLWEEVQGSYRAELTWLQEELATRVQDAPLTPLVLQLLNAGGKRVRPLLAWMSGEALGAPRERVHAAALAAELTHTATLLHDDVLDEGAERRGVPAARIVYGNRMSVLGGDFLLSRALDVVTRTRVEELIFSFSRSLEKMIEGEVLQQQHRFHAYVPEVVYHDIVGLKTASLFAWTAGAAARLAGADARTAEAFEQYGQRIGIAFQILDDWLDWMGDPVVIGKAVRADLKEGKPSLAVIYGCEMSLQVRSWVEEHLRSDAPPPGDEPITKLAEELCRCGALARVRKNLRQQIDGSAASIPMLSGTASRKRLEHFTCLLLARDH